MNPMTTFPLNILCDGDSRTYGTGLNNGEQYPSRLAVHTEHVVTNLGVPSERIVDFDTRGAATDAYISATKNNVLFVLGGVCDFFTDGASAATILSRMKTYCGHRRAAGWKVYVVTELDAGAAFIGAGWAGVRYAYNASVRLEWPTFCDGVVDAGADIPLGLSPTADTLIYFNSDTLHPNAEGARVLAALAYASLVKHGQLSPK